MSKEATYYGYLATGGAHLQLPTLNVDGLTVALVRVDSADSIGQIAVRNIFPRLGDYDTFLYAMETPSLLYGFPAQFEPSFSPAGQFQWALSTATAPKESVSGRAMTLAGANLVLSSPFTARLSGAAYAVAPTTQLQDTGNVIAAQENAGQTWAFETWILRTAGTLATIYLESNAGITSYLQLAISAAGVLQIFHSGTLAYSSSITAVPLNGLWSHVVLSFDGTNITYYLNGTVIATTGYTRGAYSSISLNRLNHGASNAFYLAGTALYARTLSAPSVKAHYARAADTWSGPSIISPANIAQGGGVLIVGTNAALPMQQAVPTAGNIGMTIPLLGSIDIVALAGFYQWVARVTEREEVQ